MNDLERYKEELFPLMYDNLESLFPDFKFQNKGNRKLSRCHLDGHLDRDGKLITGVDRSRPYAISDHSQGTKGLLNFYMERNSLSFRDALDQIADICKIERFQWTERSDKERKEQENRQNALSLFVNNLWKDREEARKVLDYLHARGWTDEDIKKGELGLITPDLRPLLADADSYFFKVDGAETGQTHLLAIPFRTASRILGFKFREMGVKTGQKYLNSRGTKKNEGLFGLGFGVKDAVIVEGELDALHAQVRGESNVVATTGSGITLSQAEDAIRRGVKRFTLLFDRDEAGKKFVKDSLSLLESMGVEVYVASLPDGYKDTDEYLARNTIEEWRRNLLESSISSYMFHYDEAIRKYIEIANEHNGELFDKERISLFEEIEAILTTPYLLSHPHLKEQIFRAVEEQADGLQITLSEFRGWIAQSSDRKRKEAQETRVKNRVEEISRLQREGKTEDALGLMRRTIEESEQETHSERISAYLHQDIDSIFTAMRNRPEGIKTNIKTLNGYRVILPSGGLSVIGAPTGHGKSKVLISLALDTLDNGEEGTILYLTYEEAQDAVICQVLNAYADLDLTTQYENRRKGIKRGNLQTIKEYFRTGSDRYIKDARRGTFHAKEKEFISRLKSGEMAIIRPRTDFSSELCAIIKSAVMEGMKIKGVFIDYIQRLYLPDAKVKVRTDELKVIMSDLDTTAQETGLPIVMGAQMKRETVSPDAMTNQDIADSGWIERTASEVILLWSNKERPKNDPQGKELEKINRLYPDLALGTKGKLFARLTKSRMFSDLSEAYAILDIDGNTGRVKGNMTPEDIREYEREDTSSTGETDSDLFYPTDDRPLPF